MGDRNRMHVSPSRLASTKKNLLYVNYRIVFPSQTIVRPLCNNSHYRALLSASPWQAGRQAKDFMNMSNEYMSLDAGPA